MTYKPPKKFYAVYTVDAISMLLFKYNILYKYKNGMQLTYDIKEIENWSKIDILGSLL